MIGAEESVAAGGAVVFKDDEVADVQGRAHRVARHADDEAAGSGQVRRGNATQFFG
jgi:hypothetical protein